MQTKTDSSIIALIPARAGSKGVVDKNIRPIKNHPLLAYSVKVALIAKSISRVIVSTDSGEYALIAEKYGAEVPFKRSADVSGDGSTDYDVIKHFLDWMIDDGQPVPELIVHLRPTTPLRNPSLLDEAIQKIRQDQEATALRSIHEMSETAYKCLQVVGNYLACICNKSLELDAANFPRQKFPTTYHPNGYVDILRSSFVLQNPEKIHGNKVIPFETPRTVEIDSAEDFDYLDYQISRNQNLYNELFHD